MTTVMIITISVYLLGINVAWFKLYWEEFEYYQNARFDNLKSAYPALYGAAATHRRCVKFANTFCGFSWISVGVRR